MRESEREDPSSPASFFPPPIMTRAESNSPSSSVRLTTSLTHCFSDKEKKESYREPLLVPDLEVGQREAGIGAPIPKIQIKGLTKLSEKGETILAGVNMDVSGGQIVGIIGPSGGGKSTLLRAINRLWEPPSGAVFLDGADILHLDVLSLRRKVGMLFQLPSLFEGSPSSSSSSSSSILNRLAWL